MQQNMYIFFHDYWEILFKCHLEIYKIWELLVLALLELMKFN